MTIVKIVEPFRPYGPNRSLRVCQFSHNMTFNNGRASITTINKQIPNLVSIQDNIPHNEAWTVSSVEFVNRYFPQSVSGEPEGAGETSYNEGCQRSYCVFVEKSEAAFGIEGEPYDRRRDNVVTFLKGTVVLVAFFLAKAMLERL